MARLLLGRPHREVTVWHLCAPPAALAKPRCAPRRERPSCAATVATGKLPNTSEIYGGATETPRGRKDQVPGP